MKKNKKLFLIIGFTFFSTLILVLIASSVYFQTHFYKGTVINEIDLSYETVEEAAAELSSNIATYTLDIEERGDKKEQITAADIGLRLISDDIILKLKEEQNAQFWLSSMIKPNETKLEIDITFDERLLNDKMSALLCLQSDNVIEPKSTYLEYRDDNGYSIIAEEPGNKIKEDQFYAALVEAILNGKSTINLESIDVYEKPLYVSTSQKVTDAQALLNKYVMSSITYEYNGGSKVVDGSLITQWLTIDENFDITLDSEKVTGFVAELANHYNTRGAKRNFVTSLGTTATVKGGDYGFRVNQAAEVDLLISKIQEGQIETRKPEFTQKALSSGNNDIGNTYLEINLTAQHAWFYKNGKLISDGDIVTGDVLTGTTTPSGIYSLKYKKKDAVLKGVDYSSDVSFWMPFNGDVGFHDAPWRTNFGKDIYLKNGSHGCVNAPYAFAQAVFANINPGTPVVCYR
ncbi:MAG: L,D-transpeptidase family protein [Clostridiaceae bacterium]